MHSVPIKLRYSWGVISCHYLDPFQDEAAGVPNYQANSQEGLEFEPINEGIEDEEVPPTQTIPPLPPINVSVVKVTNPPCTDVTANVASPVTTPSNSAGLANTPASSSASKSSKKLQNKEFG